MIGPHDSAVFFPDGTHARLFADIGHYSRVAGIEREWVWQPLADSVGPNEVQWVSRVRSHAESGSYGILYVGAPTWFAFDAMCGALVRNFIDARVRGVSALLRDDEAQECTVLLVPDFCVTYDKPAQFVRQTLASILIERQRHSRQTVLYATSPEAVLSAYGETTHAHLGEYFKGDPR